jgi:hypothetical protein
MIFGITGADRAGKDTFAKALQKVTGFPIVSFARVLKNDAHELLRLPKELLFADGIDKSKHYVTIPDYGDAIGGAYAQFFYENTGRVMTVRQALLAMGAAARDLDPDYFVESLQLPETAIISDVRFANEALVCHPLIRVTRPGKKQVLGKDLHAVFTVSNNGGLENLISAARDIWALVLN